MTCDPHDGSRDPRDPRAQNEHRARIPYGVLARETLEALEAESRRPGMIVEYKDPNAPVIDGDDELDEVKAAIDDAGLVPAERDIARFVLAVTYRLKCGHTLSHRCSATGMMRPGNFENASQVLQYWFHARAKRHRCELVTDMNPNGIAPR